MQHYQGNEDDHSSTNSQHINRRNVQQGGRNQNNTIKNSQNADNNTGWNGLQHVNFILVKTVQQKQQ